MMAGHTPQQYETYNDNWAEVQNRLKAIKIWVDHLSNPYDDNFEYIETDNITMRDLARALKKITERLGIDD
ncbi:MAG: hypothetical protein NTU79_01040 [Planctomycetota bacterium]|nr:hypothetical protein [Planctomycetota bacterium]